MLYLVRKINQSIIINDNIEVKVMEVKGKSVKLGFEFPSDATVLRKEVHDRIIAENIAAAQGGEGDITELMAGGDIKVDKPAESPEPKPDNDS